MAPEEQLLRLPFVLHSHTERGTRGKEAGPRRGRWLARWLLTGAGASLLGPEATVNSLYEQGRDRCSQRWQHIALSPLADSDPFRIGTTD